MGTGMQRENTPLAHNTAVSKISAFKPHKRISDANLRRRDEKEHKQKFRLMHFTAGMQQLTHLKTGCPAAHHTVRASPCC